MRLLERLGYRPEVVSNGREVLETLRRQSYDLVLLDVQMPEMDGFEAARRIQAEFSSSVPRLVAMTANAMLGDREACLAAGMDDYFSKPIRVDELSEALDQCQASLAENGSDGLDRRPEGGRAAAEIRDRPPHAGLKELLALAGDDADFLKKLIGTFLHDAEQLCADLRRAVAEVDASALRLAAHSLKSNAEQFGAILLAGECRALEALGREGAAKGAAPGVARVETEFGLVRTALEQALLTWKI
jgi:CheY-like chemotaxis protein